MANLFRCGSGVASLTFPSLGMGLWGSALIVGFSLDNSTLKMNKINITQLTSVHTTTFAIKGDGVTLYSHSISSTATTNVAVNISGYNTIQFTTTGTAGNNGYCTISGVVFSK